MPRRRRVQKRRIDPQIEANAWAGVFDCGYDFFSELSDIGIADPTGSIVPAAEKPAAVAAFRDAAETAWRRHGAQFLANWQPTAVREKPWALEEFGSPSCR